MLSIYNSQMSYVGKEDKKIVHQTGLWHKVFGGIMYNKKAKKIYFQTIYPKEAYTFDRDDFIDFSVGGHIEDDEKVIDAGVREVGEELGITIDKNDLKFLGIRICNCDLSDTYKIREFQHFYAFETTKDLKDMEFLTSDSEVKSVIEIDIDDFLSLLMGSVKEIIANEMVLDRTTREGKYFENVNITYKRIIPDYYKDKSILEKFLAVKSLID